MKRDGPQEDAGDARKYSPVALNTQVNLNTFPLNSLSFLRSFETLLLFLASTVMKISIRYRCGNCRQALGSPQQQAATATTCPSCGARILVPTRSLAEFRRRPSRRKASSKPKTVTPESVSWSAAWGWALAILIPMILGSVIFAVATIMTANRVDGVPQFSTLNGESKEFALETATEKELTPGQVVDTGSQHPRLSVVKVAVKSEPNVTASVIEPTSPRKVDVNEAYIRQFIATHCNDCHGSEIQESGLRLDTIDLAMSEREDVEVWQEVLDRMNAGEMPPRESKQPAVHEEAAVLNWLHDRLREARAAVASNGGHVVMRRLNRAEYVNTVHDLMGIDFDPDDESLPADSEALGFDTIGSELVISGQLMKKYIFLAQKVTQEVISRGEYSESYQRIFGSNPHERHVSNARTLLNRFAARAFRRPVQSDKLDRLASLVEDTVETGSSFEDGILLAVQAILCSPQFIYMIEEPGELDDFAIATRLSYFLWSSMPDDELLAVADRGELHEPDVLRQQTLRLLDDRRCGDFVSRFAGQWLGVREVGIMQPDKELFPDYDEELENAMRQETITFFAEILEHNLSIFEFIGSEFTMLNERLAKHYGIPGVQGRHFRRVTLRPADHRGGVLGHAGILTITSDGVRSSPVVRGVWILNNLLGSPPSPPPANVPDLEPDTRGTRTIREELARHREIESCNSCHRKIDPLGFALENYDAIGRWRTHYPAGLDTEASGKSVSVPVDAGDIMANGERFRDIDEFKNLLLKRKSEFRRCLIRKLLTYATGRGLDLMDRSAVDKIASKATANGDLFRDLIVDVVASEPFGRK